MKIGKLLAASAAVLALSAAASADAGVDAGIKFCSAQTDDRARLACYDAIAARLKADQAMPAPIAQAPAAAPPLAAPPVAAPPAATPAAPAPVAAVPPQTPESAFGAESIPLQARSTETAPQDLDEIQSTVTALSYTGLKRAVLTLANGQVWRQSEGDTKPFPGKIGDHVTISRGFISGYNVTIEGRSGLYKFNRRS